MLACPDNSFRLCAAPHAPRAGHAPVCSHVLHSSRARDTCAGPRGTGDIGALVWALGPDGDCSKFWDKVLSSDMPGKEMLQLQFNKSYKQISPWAN